MSVSLPLSLYLSKHQNSMMKENKTKHQDPFPGMTRIVREQGNFNGVCGQILFITCPGMIKGVRYAKLH